MVELADLIRWLPELATDSELDEPSWNRVVELSEQMQVQISPLVNLPPEQQSTAFEKLEATLASQLTELQAFAASLPDYTPVARDEVAEVQPAGPPSEATPVSAVAPATAP